MKKITTQSYVKVIKCSENRHNGYTGHIISKRLKTGYNLKLTNHENCSAKKVKVLVFHPVIKERETKPTNWWSWLTI